MRPARAPRSSPSVRPAAQRREASAGRSGASLTMPHHDIGRLPVAGPNRTGLPDGLKAGLERMSGIAMDAVRVHYRSPEPARIGAHAYAKGTDIHLGPGQEKHLPHEAWHVVQQAEGRVNPTAQVGGAPVNDDAGLEREADRMGHASAARGHGTAFAAPQAASPVVAPGGGIVQGVFRIKAGDRAGNYTGKTTGATNTLIDETRDAIGDELAVGWVGGVREWATKGEGPYSFEDTDEYYDLLRENYPKVEKEGKVRPNFSSGAYKLAKIAYGLQTGNDEMDMKPSEEDLAMPHRFPFGGIKRSTEMFLDGSEDESDLERWSSRLEVASAKRLKVNLSKITKPIHKTYYKKEVEGQITSLRQARKRLIAVKKKMTKLTLLSPEVQDFLKSANNMHGNIPDFGPHTKVNIPVRDRVHLRVEIPDKWDGKTRVPMSPGSQQASLMSPHRSDIALDSTGKYYPTTSGEMVPVNMVEGSEFIDQYGSNTTIDPKNFKRYKF